MGVEVLRGLDRGVAHPDERQPERHHAEGHGEAGEQRGLRLGDGAVQLALDQVPLAGQDGIEQGGVEERERYHGHDGDRDEDGEDQGPGIVAGDHEHEAADDPDQVQDHRGVEPGDDQVQAHIGGCHQQKGQAEEDGDGEEHAHGVRVAEAVHQKLDQKVGEHDDQEVGVPGPDEAHRCHAHPSQRRVDERDLIGPQVRPEPGRYGPGVLPAIHPSGPVDGLQGPKQEVEGEYHEEQHHCVVVSVREHRPLDVPRH